MQNLYIGLMSGTSMDGIDAAIVDLETNKIHTAILKQYSENTAAALRQLSNSHAHSLEFFWYLHSIIGEDFAAATQELLQQSGLSSSDIVAIGSHGQTVLHQQVNDRLLTCQLGSGQIIAHRTGIPVVADFRQKDILLGGKGAPLAPLYHRELFNNLPHPLAVVNIGGIANISFLEADASPTGYDVGPGNVLMDAWTQQHLGKNYDQNGTWAQSGVVQEDLLDILLQDPIMHTAIPRSFAKEYFSPEWLQKKDISRYSAKDVQATLLMYTVIPIIFAIKSYSTTVKSVLICGGGVHNIHLMQRLRSLMPDVNIIGTDAIGINPDFIEAQLMAWLAYKYINNQAVDYRRITGASAKGIYGVYYPCS